MTSEYKLTGELQELTQDKQVMPKENYRDEQPFNETTQYTRARYVCSYA